MKVPFSLPCIDQTIIDEVISSLKSGWITTGPKVKALEEEVAKYTKVENANRNITINNINLGYSDLGMIKEVPEQYMEQIKSTIPMKRLCSLEDIGRTVNYLLNTKYNTGESININEGLA